MKLVQTTIEETTVRMRLADHADPTEAVEWIEFQVPLSGLTHSNNQPLGQS
jgi:hypothetical protein